MTPPDDYVKWSVLIDRLVRHWQKRYGKEEIRKWYYEVWNEPNLKPFWTGTRTQYLELYKATVNTIKAIDKNLRVGGPATSNFVPDERFDGEAEDVSCHKTFRTEDLNALELNTVKRKSFLWILFPPTLILQILLWTDMGNPMDGAVTEIRCMMISFG